jgi:hypothetical protein
MKAVTEQIALPWPTNATTRAPRLTFKDHCLTLEYDFEGEDETIKLTRIVFKGVLAYRYSEWTCCDAEDITGSGFLVRMRASGWLEEIRQRWLESVGWQESEQRKGSAERFQHFHIYFDDMACVDVVGSSFLLS